MASNETEKQSGHRADPSVPAQGGSAPAAEPRHAETQVLLGAMDKALRMHALYEGRGDNFLQARGQAFGLMTELLERHGEIKLHIEPHQFTLDDAPVWINEGDKQGPAYRMFKDGLRIISFTPGMEQEEFLLLMEAMQGPQPGQEVNNAVTLLWEADPKHIRYRAIRIFQEGTEDSDLGGGSEDIGGILGMLRQPLHRPGSAYSRPEISAEGLGKAERVRAKLLAGLESQGGHEKFLASLRQEVARVQEDTWPRAIHIAARMVQLGLDATQVSGILSHVLEEMLANGKWANLGETCRVMSATIAHGQDGEADNSQLETILERLTADGRIKVLEPRLMEATPEQFDELSGFLGVLPASANDELRRILMRLPLGPVQSALRKLLEERGVEMTELFATNLKSSNQEQVISAIGVLADMGTSEAIRQLPEVLNHPSARVRLEALKAMGGKVKAEDLSEEVVAQLIPSLGTSYPDLPEAAFEVLGMVRRSGHSDALVNLLEKPESAAKLNEVRRLNILVLMTTWGGTRADDFIIDHICAGGLFIGRKGKELREALLTALEMVGGVRARNLIAAAMARQPNKAVRAQLDELARRLP